VIRAGLDLGRGRTGDGPLGVLVVLLLVLGACGRLAAPARTPLTAEELHDLGLAHYARGDHVAAARAFRRAALLRPGWARPLVNLGDALLGAADVDGAIEAYERARAVEPDEPAILNNLAWALLQHESRFAEAEPLIRRALSRDPTPRGYYLDTLGLVLLKRGEPEPALEAFRAALRDPGVRDRGTRALVLGHVAEALQRLGDPEGAEACERAARALGGPAAPPAAQAPEDVGPSEIVC
jgi:protein O-GlcNAc transferase